MTPRTGRKTGSPKMHGVRVYFRSWHESHSGFERAFAPIYPYFSDLYFVESNAEVADGLFQFPYDEIETLKGQVLSTGVVTEGSRSLYRSESLVRFDHYVSDDWNQIVLSDIADLRLNATVTNYIFEGVASVSEIESRRVLFFHNYDGAFWQVFSNVGSVLAALIQAHRQDDAFDLRHVDYSVDYPDPGAYRTDYPPPVSTGD